MDDKGHTECTQPDEKVAGPKEDIQQATPLQVIDFCATQADFESMTRTFLDKRLGPNKINGSEFSAFSPLEVLEMTIAFGQEVFQAQILLSKRSNYGILARIHTAVSESVHLVHGPLVES